MKQVRREKQMIIKEAEDPMKEGGNGYKLRLTEFPYIRNIIKFALQMA